MVSDNTKKLLVKALSGALLVFCAKVTAAGNAELEVLVGALGAGLLAGLSLWLNLPLAPGSKAQPATGLKAWTRHVGL